jgi:hypothetical protein
MCFTVGSPDLTTDWPAPMSSSLILALGLIAALGLCAKTAPLFVPPMGVCIAYGKV